MYIAVCTSNFNNVLQEQLAQAVTKHSHTMSCDARNLFPERASFTKTPTLTISSFLPPASPHALVF